jgi:hypothetical protein
MKILNKSHTSEFHHCFCNFKYDSDVNGKIPTFQTLYFFVFLVALQSNLWALATSMKLFVSFRLLSLGQSAGLLGRVISSSQGLCVSAPGDCEDGEVGGMKWFWQGKLKYSEKTCLETTLSTTNPTCQIRARTQATAVGSLRLTVSAMARPNTV